MNTSRHHLLLVLGLVLLASTALAGGNVNIFFLHHSTGRNLINEGDMRGVLEDYNQDFGVNLEFWDHDYNYIGLRDEGGDLLGYDYDIPGDNTDPDGLHYLWTTGNAARDSLIHNHDVIAFKSCYPASAIGSDTELETRKAWYREMRAVFDQHPDKVFVVVSQPPLHRLNTNTAEADRARAFANWLMSDEYLAGHANVVGFDLFDRLAEPASDGYSTRNRLRYEYERSHTSSDSHPNELANQTVGPVFMGYLANVARSMFATAVPGDLPAAAGPVLLGNQPNPFNPSTSISLRMPEAGWARLEIYDLRGSLVTTLLSGQLAEGIHQVRWDGTAAAGATVASGVYRAVLSSAAGADSRSVTLVK
jgi:hypothetical protein